MPLVATGNNTEFEPAPIGTHRAVCWRIIDVGVQETKFGSKRQVAIGWQLDELRDDGKPFMVQRRYNMILTPGSSLREDLETWRGKAFTDLELEGFDLEALLGVSCLVNVVHSEDGKFANVANLSGIPKGMEKMAPVDTPYLIDGPRAAAWDQLSDGMKDTVTKGHIVLAGQQAEDTKDRAKPAQPDLDLDDEIPF